MDFPEPNSACLNSPSVTRSGICLCVCLCLLLMFVGGCGNRGDLYLVPDDIDRLLEDDVRSIGENPDDTAIDKVPADDEEADGDLKKPRSIGDSSQSDAGNGDAITEEAVDGAFGE